MIERPIDELGRIVIPAEYRRRLGIRAGDLLEIRLDALSGVLFVDPAVSSCSTCTGRVGDPWPLGVEDIGRLVRVGDRSLCDFCVAYANDK